MVNVISVATPYKRDASSCGYCSSPVPGSFRSASLYAKQLSCDVYQRMINRGWRRSGAFCYKPDLKRSCCPQYTIKLDALEMKPSRSQRKLVNRWNRFVIVGDEGLVEPDSNLPRVSPKALKHKSPPFSLISSIHASEKTSLHDTRALRHDFQVTLEPSTFTQEKFQLYRIYQRDIHSDLETSPQQFNRFLVNSPLVNEPIPYAHEPPSHLPSHYGSYHQMYRLDGKLIAMAVLDILPNCLSSVYFMYDSAWEKFSFGKLSALREVSLAREINDAGAPGLGWLYMGFYIHSCQKMRYKGEYCPSYLADPETYDWYPIEECIPLLDKNRYACFSHPELSIESKISSDERFLDSASFSDRPDNEHEDIPEEVLREVLVVSSVNGNQLTVIPVLASMDWYDHDTRYEIATCIRGLGFQLAKDVILKC